jgi:hypothetical protein
MYNFKYTKVEKNSYVKFKIIPPKYRYSDVYGKDYKIFKPFVITDYVGNRIGWINEENLKLLLGHMRYTKVVLNWSKEESIERYLERCDLTIFLSELLNKKLIKYDKRFKEWMENIKEAKG